jgi:diguanylate cyclase (GGDEF)-like protein/PAS domain S-box-containing protein
VHAESKKNGPPSAAYLKFRRKLILSLCGIYLLTTVFLGLSLYNTDTERKQTSLAQTANLAAVLEAHVLNAIRLADLGLVDLATQISALPPLQRQSPETISKLLNNHPSTFTDDFWNIYIDRYGIGVASSKNNEGSGFDFNSRDYFNVHTQKAKSLFVGEPRLGQLSGKYVFYLSRRVEAADGGFAGVIAAPVDASRFAAIFSQSLYDEGLTVTLSHGGGKIIASAPEFEKKFAQVTQPSTGLSSVRNVANLPLLITVSRDKNQLESQFARQSAISAVGLVLILIVLTASARLILRNYRSIHAKEQDWKDSESRLRTIADNLPILIARVDQREKITFANQQLCRFYNIPEDQITGISVAELLGEENYAASRTHVQGVLEGFKQVFERQTRVGSHLHWQEVTYLPDSASGGFFVMVEDITDRKKNLESMLLSSLVFDNTSEGMLITELDGSIISVNPAFTRLTGYELHEMEGRHLSAMASEVHDPEFFANIRRSIARTGHWQGEIWNRLKNGDQYLISITFNTVYQGGKPFRRIALFSDITLRKANEDLIWHQANYDALTGLANRRMFQERLRHEIRKSERSGDPVGLMFIDLDRFKEVNDTLGHDYGDGLLKEAAQRMRECVRSTDMVSRLGGDEFTVLLPELHHSGDAARIASDLLRRLAATFRIGEQQATISASIGIAVFPTDGTTADILLRNADRAMYAAKELGRNRFNFYDS